MLWSTLAHCAPEEKISPVSVLTESLKPGAHGKGAPGELAHGQSPLLREDVPFFFWWRTHVGILIDLEKSLEVVFNLKENLTSRRVHAQDAIYADYNLTGTPHPTNPGGPTAQNRSRTQPIAHPECNPSTTRSNPHASTRNHYYAARVDMKGLAAAYKRLCNNAVKKHSQRSLDKSVSVQFAPCSKEDSD